MAGFEQAWHGVRQLGWYRRLRAAQRILAVTFLATLVVVVVGAAAGLPNRAWVVALYLCVALGAIGGFLAWGVVALVAAAFARRPVDPGGERFTPAWLVPLAALYCLDIAGVRR